MNTVTAADFMGDKRVILFIDDEQRVLKSMRAMFRKEFKVLLANSGDEALDIVQAEHVDVVVSDQRMPHMTGVEVLTRIRQEYPDIVRVLLTGYADLEAIEASLNEAEVFRYLMKPSAAEDIREAIHAGLEAHQPLTVTEPAEPLDSEPPLEAEPPLLAEVVTFPVGDTTLSRQSPTLAAPDSQPQLAPKSDAPTPEAQTTGAPTTEDVDAPTNRASPPHDQSAKAQTSIDIVLLGELELATALNNLEHTGKVHTAADLDHVARLCDVHPVGILILDVSLDQMAGMADAARNRFPETVVLVASDRSDAMVLIQLINSGVAYRFIVKPAQAARLQITMDAAVDLAAACGRGNAPTQPAATPAWQRWVKRILGRTS